MELSEDLKKKGQTIVECLMSAQHKSASDLFLSLKMAQRVLILQELAKDIHHGDHTLGRDDHAYLTLQFLLPHIYPSL